MTLFHGAEYVIQKYVSDPKLWNGFKFHFRMYSMLRGDMSSFLYQKAFILTAGLKYDRNSDDLHTHITNLSVNKKMAGHPGQIPINVKVTHPEVRRSYVSTTTPAFTSPLTMIVENNLNLFIVRQQVFLNQTSQAK